MSQEVPQQYSHDLCMVSTAPSVIVLEDSLDRVYSDVVSVIDFVDLVPMKEVRGL